MLIHGTSVSLGSNATLIRGTPGSGKSDLALRFLHLLSPLNKEPTYLIVDDQTLTRKQEQTIVLSCPPNLKGKLEVRGVGIITVPNIIKEAQLTLLVDLCNHEDVARLPNDDYDDALFGVKLPRLALYPFEQSAAVKLLLALQRSAKFSG